MSRLIHSRVKQGKADDVLRAVLAEINKSVVKPDKGFMTADGWAEKWKYTRSQAYQYINFAVSRGILVRKDFRVQAKGRVRLMAHYGKPPKKK